MKLFGVEISVQSDEAMNREGDDEEVESRNFQNSNDGSESTSNRKTVSSIRRTKSMSDLRGTKSMSNLSSFIPEIENNFENNSDSHSEGYVQQDIGTKSNQINNADLNSDGNVQDLGTKSSQINKGIPWSEDEHRAFLHGVKVKGRGDWKGISNEFVPTRTPTQVASHAQKYFNRMSAKRKRRTSVFDITLAPPPPAPLVINKSSTTVPSPAPAPVVINKSSTTIFRKNQPLVDDSSTPSNNADETSHQANETAPVMHTLPQLPQLPQLLQLPQLPQSPFLYSSQNQSQGEGHPTISWVPVLNFSNNGQRNVFLSTIQEFAPQTSSPDDSSQKPS